MCCRNCAALDLGSNGSGELQAGNSSGSHTCVQGNSSPHYKTTRTMLTSPGGASTLKSASTTRDTQSQDLRAQELNRCPHVSPTSWQNPGIQRPYEGLAFGTPVSSTLRRKFKMKDYTILQDNFCLSRVKHSSNIIKPVPLCSVPLDAAITERRREIIQQVLAFS